MSKEQILIVDHVEDRREHLVSMLENQGMAVIQTATCEECLALLEKSSFRIILSETDLPRKSGLYLLKETKKLSPQTEIILLTHNASSFTLLQAIRHGAYDFILRPIDSGEILFNTLSRAIDHIQQREERDALLQELEEKNHSLNLALHRMKSLTDNIRKMAQSDQIEEIFSIMLEAATEEINAETGLIGLFNKAGDSLALKLSQKIPPEVSSRYAKLLPEGLIQVIARRGKPILVATELPKGLSALCAPEDQELLKLPGLVSVPLRLNKRIAGLMILSGHPDKTPFAEHDLLYLTQLSTHAQLQLEKAGQIHRLRKTSIGYPEQNKIANN